MDCWQGFARARARPWSSAAKRASAKTELLRYTAGQASGFRVAQPTGVEAEMELPCFRRDPRGVVRTPVRRRCLGLRIPRSPTARRVRADLEVRLETLGKDLSPHLVFGIATAAAFRLLAHGAVDK
jgi:hypothetical protein